MKTAILIVLIAFTLVSACRKESQSRSKSIVGLEADLDPSVLNGEAPSFLQLQKWFQGELPVSNEKAQGGHVKYQVHADFNESTMASLPAEYRDKITAYLLQQGQRVADFQANLKNPAKLNELLKLESAEMQDILMGLIVVGYKPRTNDLLAHMVAHPPLRNFIDRYSVELLEKLYQRSQRSLMAGLPKETENFAKLLSKAYVTTSGANETFIASLKDDCSKVQRMLASLQVSKSIPCTAASGMNLSSSVGSVADNAKSIGGPTGRVMGIFGGVAAPNGFAMGGSNQQLQIFAGKDAGAGDPYAGGGGTTGATSGGTTGGTTGTYNNTTGSTTGGGGFNNTTGGGSGGAGFTSMLAKLFSGMDDSGDDEDLNLTSSSDKTTVSLPPKPKGLCSGKSGMQLVICQRYIEALPTTEQLSGGRPSKSAKPTSRGGGFNLTGGYSFYLVAKYGTKVQNQGAEGACTAFGDAHTIGAIAKAKGKSGEYDAWKIWSRQGNEPNQEASLEAAKQMDFDGLRISNAKNVDVSVESFKRVIDSGKPVYAASDIDGSWHQDTGKLTCGGGRIGAHAYSIQGYDDASRQFIVKNSWGDSWGDQGFAYLSYDCIGNEGWENAFDITLQ